MQVENNGETIIFDQKTTEAIEAGKNRITLLQTEELRYNKLITELKAQVISVDNELADKTKRFESVVAELNILVTEVEDERILLESITQEHLIVTSVMKEHELVLTTREEEVLERERTCTDIEKQVSKRDASITIRENTVALLEESLKEKRALIDEFKSKL